MYDENKTNYYKDTNNYGYCIDLIRKSLISLEKLYIISTNDNNFKFKLHNNYYIKIIDQFIDTLIENKTLKIITFKNGVLMENKGIDYNIFIKLLQNNNRIEELCLKDFKGGSNLNKFLEYLQTNTSLKKLQLSYNNYNNKYEKINDELLALLIKNNKTIEYLDISNLYININQLDLILEYLKYNTTLKILILSIERIIRNYQLNTRHFTDNNIQKEINNRIKNVHQFNKTIQIYDNKLISYFNKNNYALIFDKFNS